MQPAIYGLSGESLSEDERAFFRDADPAGYILFKRNCSNREQLRALTDSLRALSGRDDLPILVDQEGGRIARLSPPVWPAFPEGGLFDRLYAKAPMSAIEAARLNGAAIAAMLKEVGVNVDCLPLLDLRHEGAHDVIGDRALGAEPMQVAALGRVLLDGLEAGGVCGIVKHIPGHGRACSDSHRELPVVTASAEELEADLAPFRSLNWAPMAMTAHVLYTAWDTERCATLSPVLIERVIRGEIGFDGLLISDDIGMGALSGDHGERAQAAIGAGCDLVLHCSGDLAEMEQVSEDLSEIALQARERLDRAMARITGKASARGYEQLAATRDALLAYV